MKHEIEIAFRMQVEYEGDQPQFYFEECRCIDDFLEDLTVELEEAAERGTCTCWRSSIKYIGPVSVDTPMGPPR